MHRGFRTGRLHVPGARRVAALGSAALFIIGCGSGSVGTGGFAGGGQDAVGGSSSGSSSSSGAASSCGWPSECKSGPCCLNCKMQPLGTQCGPPLETQFKCDKKGLMTRTIYGECDGRSSQTCKPINPHYEPWKLHKACTAPALCVEGAKKWTAHCEPAGGTCQHGPCCHKSGKVLAKGSKCAEGEQSSFTKCINHSIHKVKRFTGCDGVSGSKCSSSKEHDFFDTPTHYKSCGDMVCVQKDPTTAVCRPKADGPADLLAVSLTAADSAEVKAGVSIAVKYARKNIGLDNAYYSLDAFYLSKDAKITKDDAVITKVGVPIMQPGETWGPKTKKLYISKDTEAGTWFIGYVVDVKDEVKEADETNNTAVLKISVL